MDIVERLHDPEQGLTSSDRFHLHKDAAAEIERLRAVLRAIMDETDLDSAVVLARYALGDDK